MVTLQKSKINLRGFFFFFFFNNVCMIFSSCLPGYNSNGQTEDKPHRTISVKAFTHFSLLTEEIYRETMS